MDLIGIEPMTSSMPWKRAPSCATGPHRRVFLLSLTRRDSSIEVSCGVDWNAAEHHRWAVLVGSNFDQPAQGMLRARDAKSAPMCPGPRPGKGEASCFLWASVLGNWIFIFLGLAVFVDPVCNGLLQRSVPCCLRRNWHGLATDIPLVASLTGYVTSETPLFFRSEAH